MPRVVGFSNRGLENVKGRRSQYLGNCRIEMRDPQRHLGSNRQIFSRHWSVRKWVSYSDADIVSGGRLGALARLIRIGFQTLKLFWPIHQCPDCWRKWRRV
jgi:hypothetical protein